MATSVGCSVVSKRFLPLARVVASSFREHHPGVPFVVLLTDEVDGRFDPAGEPFELVHLHQLDEAADARFRFGYEELALAYAATPYLLDWLLARGHRQALFFKQESLVVGSHAALFERLGREPILLTPHLLAPLGGDGAAERELAVLRAGAFNAGLVGIGAQPEARRFLAWWKDRVRAHCVLDVAAGIHWEQRWLDLVPSYFPGARWLREPEWNVGHWSLPEHRVERAGGGWRVDGAPARLFRFSGFDVEQAVYATRHSSRLLLAEMGDAAAAFAEYARAVLARGYHAAAAWPYSWAAFDDGVAIPPLARDLLRGMGEAATAFGDPFRTGSPASFSSWLVAPAPQSADPRVNRLLHAVHERRPDVRAAFPDALSGGVGTDAFLAWARTHGAAEHALPPALLHSSAAPA